MMKKIPKFVFILTVVAFIASCRSLKPEGAQGLVKKKQANECLLPVAAPLNEVSDFEARVSMELTYNNRILPVKAKLRMRRNEVIQFSVTALGMVEIARVEFTQEAAYFIDRIGKRYASVRYADLPLLKGSDIDFNVLQALFWNELFVPGITPVVEHLDLFQLESSGTQMRVQPAQQKQIACSFFTDARFQQLQQTTLGYQEFQSEWKYADFKVTDGKSFPGSLSITVAGDSQWIGAEMTFSNVNFGNKGWTTRTSLSNYSQVSLQELVSKISVLRQ